MNQVKEFFNKKLQCTWLACNEKNIKLKREGKPHMLLWIFAIWVFDSSYVGFKCLQVATHHHLWSSQIPLKFSTILQNISHPLNPICDCCNDNTPLSSLNWSQSTHAKKNMIAQASKDSNHLLLPSWIVQLARMNNEEEHMGLESNMMGASCTSLKELYYPIKIYFMLFFSFGYELPQKRIKSILQS
jgi:hypothetical protein